MFESFYSLSFGSPVAFVLMLLATMLLVFYFHRRAGSSYGFINRVYALVMGGGEFYNEDIGSFWKERRDIERFNALFNVGARSIEEIVGFKVWVEKFGIDVRLLTNLRRRIDLERMKVVKVKWWEAPFFVSILLFFTIVFMFFLSIASSSSALLKFKGDDQWLWLGHEKAYSTRLHNLVSDEEWVITKKECERTEGDYEVLMSESGLNEKIVEIICNSFFDEEESLEVGNIIREQKSIYVPVAFSFLFMLIPFFELLIISRVITARRHVLHKYLYHKNT
ncbi:DUF6216 family protein [Halomonas sp. WWR20]